MREARIGLSFPLLARSGHAERPASCRLLTQSGHRSDEEAEIDADFRKQPHRDRIERDSYRAGDRSRDANPMPLVMSAGTYQSEQGYNRVARVEA
jgi:hypothetical protein